MPYFTKKGTGKNKGKTCVYKKSSKKKVGCTAGPVEKYLTALRMAESEDLEWILDEGKDKTYIIEKLKETFKEYGVYVDWDLDYDRNVNPDGYYEEYFGRFWYEATGGRAYFIDLYESSEGFFFRLYKLDETDDQYYIDDTYSQQYTLEKEADKFCLLVAFLVLNQCGKLKSTRSFINKTSVNESELSWIEDLEPEFNATMLRYGQKFKNKWGDIIRTIMFIEQDDYEVSYEKPMTGLTFKIVDDPSGYRPYPSHPKDHPLNSELTFNPIEFDRGLRSGQLIPMFTDEEFRLKESDEMDWIRDIEADMLIPGEIYDIKTGNGYYWIPEKFIGKEWDNEYNQEVYKFKDLDGSGSGRKSTQYVKDLINKGEIRPYDPNWSVRDEITFTNNIEDALNGSFAIYFKDGVYLDQTKELQDRLFDMGFSFYTKGPNQYITSEDSPKKIQFFECINWDTSNDRYRNMPPDQWDNKKVMLVSVDGDSLSRWTRRGDDKRLEDQKLFLNIVDNNVIVINGDGYVNNDLKESEGFDWVDLQSDRPLHNVTFKVKGYPEIYTIKDDGLRSSVKLTWTNDFGEKQTSTYMRDTVNKYFKKGIWEPFEGTITESSDLEWIQKQEPERVIKKSKSYGIDVRHLKSEPPNSPLSPRYNDLTKEDILDKLRDLGYNVSDIDVDSATYFYVEPSDDAGYWEDDVTWVKQDHWVDYETTEKDDPTFGGKYEMIDVDEFMFLIDNNLITESDFDWLDMGEPMSICEAQHKLNVGDTIIVSYLGAWLDSSGEDLIDADNATATVLAIDDCNKIHTTNTSNDKTILIHVNEPYTGFDEDWVRDFKPKYQKPCMDGRCMFLICGDKDFKDTKITKLPSKIFGENKKPINEVAGISFETRKWAEIIYNEIISNPEEKTRLIIDGYDHPEAFDGFPIDYVVVDFYDRLTGYGQEHSGYDKDGNYVVLLYVQPKLVSGQGGYSLQSALNHEMKHAWEDYNRLSKGLPSIEQTKESQQLYNRDYILMLSDQNIRGPIKEILKYYYYLSNLEKSAYLENVYDQNPVYERVVRDIASKDFESFKDRFDLDVNWHLMNTAYNIPFLKKFKSPREFIDYSAEELRSRALKMIKKMNKMKYIHGKM